MIINNHCYFNIVPHIVVVVVAVFVVPLLIVFVVIFADKEALARRLDGMKGSGSRTVRSPAATSLKPGTPDYLSKWTGPQ